MNILGIGPLELLILAVIALIVLGPKGLTDLGHKTGRIVRKITRSPIWNDLVSTSRDINELPKKIMRDVDLEDELHDIQNVATDSPRHDHKTTSPLKPPNPDSKQMH
jgi:Sec-independent protein translocase protein TatA